MKHVGFLLLAFLLTASSSNDGREANEAFENERYSRAVKLYEQAIEQDPENSKLHFNLASALYKLGRTEEAMQAYDRFESLTESSEEQSFASYNQGTMLSEEEKYEQAVDYFREALEKNPHDPDARHNYELAMKYQKQEEQEKQQQQQNEQGDNNQQENEQQQNQQQQNNDNRQNQNQNQPPTHGQQQDQQQKNEQEKPMPRPTEMTPEEAKNILDALKQLERELLENMKKESTETQPENGKNW